MRLPLVDGHGNFESLDDGPAAMRYTECRMAAAAVAMTDGLDEDTVDFKPNYDGKDVEPTVLPAAFPNLLVNGATGIAVGMATSAPPHNLVEVVQALRHLIKHPDADIDELMRFIPGPDLPVAARSSVWMVFAMPTTLGKGRSGCGRPPASNRCIHVVRGIVITELPYLIEAEAGDRTDQEPCQRPQAAGDRRRQGPLGSGQWNSPGDRDQSGFNPDAILEQLYKLTKIEDNFAINAVALVDGQPRTDPAGHAHRLPRASPAR